MKTNKFEQLVEYIINEDESKAKALFHQIVVEKSRDIYESLEDESRFPIQRGRGAESLSDEIEDHEEGIEGDEHGMHEDDEEFGGDELGGDEFGDEEGEFSDDDAALGGEPELGGEMGGEEELEDRVMDLEDAIDELKAEFDQLMAGEEHEEEEFPGIHGDGNPDTEMASDLDSAEDEEESGAEEDDDEEEMGESRHADDDEEEDDEEEQQDESRSVYETAEKKNEKKLAKAEKVAAGKKATAKQKAEREKQEVGESRRKSPADLMREYVEKVTAVKPVEGDEVGTGDQSGGKVNVNKKSTQIGGKNDMGGTTANIARGGAEVAPDGTSPYKDPKNEYAKGKGDLPGAGKFANVAGGRGDKLTKVGKPSSKEGAPAGAKNTEGGTINTRSPDQATGGKPGFTQAKKG